MEAVIAAATGLLVTVGTHIASLRLRMGLLRAYLICFMCGLLATAAVAGNIATSTWPLLTAIILFGSWWIVFYAFVGSAETSLRVRILREIIAANGVLPKQELLKQYNDRFLIRIRLARLMDSGALIKCGDRLVVKSIPLRFLARTCRFWKYVVFGRYSERM
jgi:hypothetical protein